MASLVQRNDSSLLQRSWTWGSSREAWTPEELLKLVELVTKPGLTLSRWQRHQACQLAEVVKRFCRDQALRLVSRYKFGSMLWQYQNGGWSLRLSETKRATLNDHCHGATGA